MVQWNCVDDILSIPHNCDSATAPLDIFHEKFQDGPILHQTVTINHHIAKNTLFQLLPSTLPCSSQCPPSLNQLTQMALASFDDINQFSQFLPLFKASTAGHCKMPPKNIQTKSSSPREFHQSKQCHDNGRDQK